MEISIFDVLGPVMIGPSSSHTAGAARLGRLAAELVPASFVSVDFGLSGSFAKTCQGHGTNKALLAGVLGMMPDDERIVQAEKLAKRQGLHWSFYTEDLDWIHENAAHLTFHHEDGRTSQIWGSSIGGGRITLNRIGDFETRIHGEDPTLLVRHIDRPGVISDITRVLAEHNINIAVFRLARQARGEAAYATIIVDNPIPPTVIALVQGIPHVEEVIHLDVS